MAIPFFLNEKGLSRAWEVWMGKRVKVEMEQGESLVGEIPDDWFQPKDAIERMTGKDVVYEKVPLKVNGEMHWLVLANIRSAEIVNV